MENIRCPTCKHVRECNSLNFGASVISQFFFFFAAIRNSISDDWSSTGFAAAAEELEGSDKVKEKRMKEKQKEREKVEKEKEGDEGEKKKSRS